MPVNAALMYPVNCSASFMNLAPFFSVQVVWPKEKRPRNCFLGRGDNRWMNSLLDVLFGLGFVVKLAGLAVLGDDAKRLFQELACLKAIAAGVSFRLDRYFTFR